MVLHSVKFNKINFTPQKSAIWLMHHNIIPIKGEITENFINYRIHKVKKNKSFYAKKINPFITFIFQSD